VPIRVLVVDDEWVIALAIKWQVEAHGYEVSGIVGTGAAALEACAVDHPDVVFMDIQMPDMDGITATRKLMEFCPHPVVVVTGYAAYREAAEQAGAMEFILKPVLTSRIPEIIETALQRFARFQIVHRDYETCEEAIAAWVIIQKAVRRLMDRDGLSEADAFSRVQQLAAEGRVLPVAAAQDIAAG
jgi:two-component system, response regulator PdtaR